MTPSKTYSIVYLVDAWFPSQSSSGEFTGTQVHIQNIRRHLNMNGHNVELFFPANRNPLVRLLWPIIVVFQIIRYNQQHSFDLIHAHGMIAAISAKITSLLLNKPIVLTIQRATHLGMRKKTLQAALQHLTYSKITYDAIITPSATLSRKLNQTSPIHIIPNGIDLDSFDRVTMKKAAEPTIIWVGRDDPSKGVEYLKKAIHRARTQYPKLRAELVTNGRLTGVDLIRAYKKAHMFVLPSLHETQPISLLEAWAAKLPVIVTSVGDNERMVEHERNGILIEPANVNQLYKAIIRILKARSFHDKIAQAGYDTVSNHYSWKQVANETYELYVTITQQKQQTHNPARITPNIGMSRLQS